MSTTDLSVRAGARTPLEGRLLHRAAEGARDITPMVAGVVPFALAIGSSAGALVGEAVISTPQAIASAALILAGAAQLSTLQMLGDGVTPIVIVLSALIINARILLYSATLAPWFRDEPLRRRLALAAPVIDQMHFTCVPRFERGDLDDAERRWYYAGAAVWLAGAWVTTHSIAVVVGSGVPASWGLHLAAPLALAGLLANATGTSSARIAAGAAAAVAVVGAALPYQSAILVATLVGIAAATLHARRTAP